MQLSDYLDVLIPRGGAGLIRSVVENAKVPVIETGVGNCHIYVDESADVQMAENKEKQSQTKETSTPCRKSSTGYIGLPKAAERSSCKMLHTNMKVKVDCEM